MISFKSRRDANKNADRALEAAKASAVEFGRAISGKLVAEFRSGKIDAAAVANAVEMALTQAASAPGVKLPVFVMKIVLEHLHSTIISELQAAGIAPNYEAKSNDQ